MELAVPVLQIVGYQNSGKTTLITKIIEKVSHDGSRIATLKHHGHGGMPTFSDEGKDSSKHRQAGAIVTAVEGDGLLQITVYQKDGWSLDDLLAIYEKLPIDIILIEGFKKASFPKVVLLRSAQDEQLVKELREVFLVICWYRRELPFDNIPTFYIDDDERYLTWIGSYFERKI